MSLLRLVRIEVLKSRRLRIVPILLALVGAVLLFEGAPLFSASSRAIADDASALPWGRLLLSVAMINALLHPILVAVLASRQVDMENTGSGWVLNATAGARRGRLLGAKLVLLSLLLGVACAIQMSALIGIGRLSGITAPLDTGPWALYSFMLWGVDCVLAAGHVLASARFENQMIPVGIGLLGAFAAIYLFLSPPALARLVPWGYYAVIDPVRITGTDPVRFEYAEPGTAWFLGLVLLALIAFVAFARRADRIGR